MQSRNGAFSDANALQFFPLGQCGYCSEQVFVRAINKISQPQLVDNKNSIELDISHLSTIPHLHICGAGFSQRTAAGVRMLVQLLGSFMNAVVAVLSVCFLI